jgi:alkylhydroperoxidase/carboxymuconolactone decarboxylase family protein YurZ
MGTVPPAIAALHSAGPQALEGYLTLREFIMREPPEGALPLKIKELIFVLLDVLVHNTDGAKLHLIAAMRDGLTPEELAEALLQLMLVNGVWTWGLSYRLLEYARECAADPSKLGS